MAAPSTSQRANELFDDEEKLLEELENEEIPAHIRDARLAALKQQATQFKEITCKGHGDYSELNDAKDVLDLTTSEDKCVVHFFHEDFRRCAIMDKHLKILTEKHFETKFACVNVDRAKFLVEKLKIRVLPAVMCFIKGIVVDRVVGFEELGGSDNFPTEVIEKRLARSNVIELTEEDTKKKTIFGFRDANQNDDSDDSDY